MTAYDDGVKYDNLHQVNQCNIQSANKRKTKYVQTSTGRMTTYLESTTKTVQTF